MTILRKHKFKKTGLISKSQQSHFFDVEATPIFFSFSSPAPLTTTPRIFLGKEERERKKIVSKTEILN